MTDLNLKQAHASHHANEAYDKANRLNKLSEPTTLQQTLQEFELLMLQLEVDHLKRLRKIDKASLVTSNITIAILFVCCMLMTVMSLVAQ